MEANPNPTLEGIVYVLGNDAMPGLVKIGKTGIDGLKRRLKELSQPTGVPSPFICLYAAKVSKMSATETALHKAFAPYRPNSGKEFFRIDPKQAIAILEILQLDNVTSLVANEEDAIAAEETATNREQSSEQVYSKRFKLPKLQFSNLGIPVGAVLNSLDGNNVAVIVAGNKVIYEGQEMSLTRATRLMLAVNHDRQPSPYWYYQERSLKEMYDSYHSRTTNNESEME